MTTCCVLKFRLIFLTTYFRIIAISRVLVLLYPTCIKTWYNPFYLPILNIVYWLFCEPFQNKVRLCLPIHSIIYSAVMILHYVLYWLLLKKWSGICFLEIAFWLDLCLLQPSLTTSIGTDIVTLSISLIMCISITGCYSCGMEDWRHIKYVNPKYHVSMN